MAFKPIETQEELDKIIGGIRAEATERAIKKTKEEYAGFDDLKSENQSLKEQLAKAEKSAVESAEKYKDFDSKISELNAKVKGYELNEMRVKVAREAGLAYELASRISGTTEDEMRADAETLSGFFKPNSQPLADPEGGVSKENSTRTAMKKFLKDINSNNE